jgi:glutaredoxin 3
MRWDAYHHPLSAAADGAQYQSALASLTGRSTVPNIFLHEKNVGGCDDITALHRQGKLVALL